MPQNPTPAAAGDTNPTTQMPGEDAIREQVRRLLATADGYDFDGLEPHDYENHASVVLDMIRPLVNRVAELEAQAEKVTAFCAQRAEYVTSILNCHPDNMHDYDRWQGHAAARRQLSQALGLPVGWPAETEPRTAPAPAEDDDSHEAKVAEYLSTPYTDDFPSQREAGAL